MLVGLIRDVVDVYSTLEVTNTSQLGKKASSEGPWRGYVGSLHNDLLVIKCVFCCCFVFFSFAVFCSVLFVCLFVCLFVSLVVFVLFVCSWFFLHVMHVNSACCKTSILIHYSRWYIL